MTEDTNTAKDEINIYYLIDLLTKKLFLIISILIITAVISYIFFFNKNTVYSGILEINMVSSESIGKFAKLNYLMKEFGQNFDTQNPYKTIVTRESLRERFVDEFDFGIISKYVIEKLSKDQQKLISHRSFQFDKKRTELNFSTTDLDLAKPVIRNIAAEINKKIFKELLNVLEYDFLAYKDNLQYQITTFEKRLEKEKKKLIRDTETRIAFLKEQAAIAKALEIDGVSMQIRQGVTLNEEKSLTESFFIQNYYLIGYVAIEKEIELLESRNENLLDLYNPEYNKGVSKIELLKLKMDQFKNYYNDIYESVSQESDFRAAELNLDSISYSNNNREKYMLTIFAVFFTLLITVITILLRDGFTKYKNR